MSIPGITFTPINPFEGFCDQDLSCIRRSLMNERLLVTESDLSMLAKQKRITRIHSLISMIEQVQSAREGE